jgi:cyanophycinase
MIRKSSLLPIFISIFSVLAVFAFGMASPAQTPNAPQSNAPTVAGPAKGALLIVGGGAMVPELWQKFVELAGGPNARIVVIPTADEDAGISRDRTPEQLKALGVKEVIVLHTRDPKEADTEKFVEPLKTATGVWFGGGRQWRLADSYLNNRTHRELNAVLERGGIIGGSSAGATIQGSFLVRGDTKGNEIMEGDHTMGLGFLKNAAIDQHVLRRNRQFDLIPVIDAHPELLGIGIDEGTAILVQGDQFEVLGATYVVIHVRPLPTMKGATSSNATGDSTNTVSSPNDAVRKGKFYLLGKGQRFDLKTRTPITGPRSGR